MKDSARQALASEWFDRFARFGYAAKGASFGAIGVLMVRVALGDRTERADFAGAVEEMTAQPLLIGLLILLCAGFFGYAVWRVVQGVADLEQEGSDWLGLAKRSMYVIVGLTYAGFAVYALGLLGGWSTEEGEIQDWTATILGWPFGRWIIGVIGVGVLIGGIAELWFALSGSFQVELGRDDISGFQKVCLICTGGFGHSGRALVYSAAGVFAIRAALDFDPEEARGVADTIRELADQPYGVWIVAFAAAGFISYGIYYCLLAFHHHMPNEGLVRGRNTG